MNMIICRTLFCEKCFAHDRPKKGDKFVVYGSTRETFIPKESHRDGHRGFTPHIITFADPLIFKDDKVQVTVCCGVCDSTYVYKKQKIYYTFSNTKKIYLGLEDFKALVMNWCRSGYELI